MGLKNTKTRSQRDLLRMLYARSGGVSARIIAAYAKAESNGQISRESNSHDRTAAEYGAALLRDGLRKGWIFSPSK